MSSGNRKIAKRWFGYQRRETEAYLRRIESMQRLEAEEIEQKLREQRSHSEKLKAELEVMRQKKKNPPLSPEKTSLLLERLARSVEAIQRQGEAEAESLRHLQERRLERHSRRMSQLDKELQDYSEALDFLLEEASSLIRKVKDKQEPESADELEREAEEAMQVSPERETTETEWEQEDRLHNNRETEMDMSSSAKILQFKLRSIMNETAATQEEAGTSRTPMTADGMTMDEPDSKEPPVKKAEKIAEKIVSKKSSSSFWGDLEPYLEEREQQLFTEEPAELASAPVPLIEGNDQTEFTVNVTDEERRELLGMGTQQAEAKVSHESPGLSEEIVSIQNRYIVGKAAGENLHAADGRLIIAKGQRITGEIVQAAEREGKLPDLIVNMVIPGFGADES